MSIEIDENRKNSDAKISELLVPFWWGDALAVARIMRPSYLGVNKFVKFPLVKMEWGARS